MPSLHATAFAALTETDPDRKIELLAAIHVADSCSLDDSPVLPVETPGRPARPELVAPGKVPTRKNLLITENRAAMFHAFTHIEFNAINLALDAIYRFRDMPAQFYSDWLQVAREEALHFNLLREYLNTLGFDYGDFTAHNSLWEMAVKTAGDVMARMALVPRILEARGLDAIPPIRAKLEAIGETRACEILDVILRDEIGHVKIGNVWYNWCCQRRGLEPVPTFVSLLDEYDAPAFRSALNYPARRAAGFSEEELEMIESLKV